MQILKKEGAKVVVSAVDADGLDITVPTPVDWSVDGEFDVTPTADGLSAHVFPRGPTSVGTLKVVAGGLTVTADLSYTDLAPPERKAEKLNLTFTDIAPPPVMADTPPAAPPAVAGPAPDVDLP